MATSRLPRLAPLALLPALLLPSGCKRNEPTDPALTTAVQQRLASDSAISAEPIQTSVQAGVVTLSGTVSNDAARALASNDAGAVPGVRTVLNNLAVQPPIAAAPALPTPAPAPAPVEAPRSREETRRRDRHRAGTDTAMAPAPAQTTPQNFPTPPPTAPAPVEPAPPAAPVVRSVTLPAGTVIPVRLSQTLDSGSAQQGQSFAGAVASDVLGPDGTVILPQGGNVSGRVTEVQEAAHFKGNALLSLELTNIARHGHQIPISTEAFSQEGKGRGKNTATKAGVGAAAGAVLGGIFGGGKGAAIGAAAGGGSGVGINAITRGQQAQIPAETVVRFRLSTPVTVRVSGEDTPSEGSGRRPLQ